MAKVSKELLEFKKLLEEDEIETYKNGIDPTKEIDGWAPTSFHVFEGMVIG